MTFGYSFYGEELQNSALIIVIIFLIKCKNKKVLSSLHVYDKVFLNK